MSTNPTSSSATISADLLAQRAYVEKVESDGFDFGLTIAGAFIRGIRPGQQTGEYIDKVLTRLTLWGAVYITAVCLLPEFLLTGVHVAGIPWLGPRIEAYFPDWFKTGMGITFYFGGTSLLIVVGVAMDTIQQVESQLVMRNYEGFMKRSRIKGRRG